MRLNKYIIIIFLIGSTLKGCIDPYDPGDLKFENMLFIEARITDDPGVTPYVSFKHAYPFSDNYIWDETVVNTSGATIYIENTQGERWYFIESYIPFPWPASMPSYSYYFLDTNFTLQEGESYRIYIETTDGYIFESQYEKYLTSPPVEEITYNYDTWETDETGESTDGYRFYLSSRSEEEDPLYLRWSLDATYCYRVPFIASYYWTGNISCVSHEDISVAGLFDVAGVSETRIFVPCPGEFRIVTDRCVPDTLGFSDFLRGHLPAGTWIMEEEPGLYITAPVTCFDCTAKGGYTQEPPFWEK